LKLKNSALLAMCLMVSWCAVAEGSGLELSVTPGRNWESTMWMTFIPVKKTPQLAAWIETPDGKFVKTLMVTAKTGRNTWSAAPESGRPEALPVWNHAAAKTSSGVDAASSATPKAGVSVAAGEDGLVAGAEYRVRLEVNASFDYNETWTKNARAGEAGFSGVNGQPSLVYEASFVAGMPGVAVLQPIGKGSVDGSSGAVVPGFAGLTTALGIIAKAELKVK
jgi:hypothetical protein